MKDEKSPIINAVNPLHCSSSLLLSFVTFSSRHPNIYYFLATIYVCSSVPSILCCRVGQMDNLNVWRTPMLRPCCDLSDRRCGLLLVSRLATSLRLNRFTVRTDWKWAPLPQYLSPRFVFFIQMCTRLGVRWSGIGSGPASWTKSWAKDPEWGFLC